MAIIHIHNPNTNPGINTNIQGAIVTNSNFPIDALYKTEYINDLFGAYAKSAQNVIYNGLQVYIEKGSRWKITELDNSLESIFDILSKTTLPEGWIYESPEQTGKSYGWIYTPTHKGEVWILRDKDKAGNAFKQFSLHDFTESFTDAESGWKKLLQDGDATNANLQWEQLK